MPAKKPSKQHVPGYMKDAPHDYSAEEGLIGSVVIDNDCMEKLGFLSAEDFFHPSTRTLFMVITQLYERGDAIDEVTIGHYIENTEEIDASTVPPGYLIGIIANIPTSVHAEHYAKIVHRCSFQRRVLDIGGEISKLAYDEGSMNEIEEKCHMALGDLTTKAKGKPKRLRINKIVKITSRPPRYNVHLPETVLTRITWEQLSTFKKFSDLIGQVLDFIPIPIKQNDWASLLNTHLDKLEIDEAGEEASREGQIKGIIIKHLKETMLAQTSNDLELARPWQRNGNYYMASRPLLKLLKEKYKVQVEADSLYSMIRNWGGHRKNMRVGGEQNKLWGIPSSLCEDIGIIDDDEEEIVPIGDQGVLILEQENISLSVSAEEPEEDPNVAVDFPD